MRSWVIYFFFISLVGCSAKMVINPNQSNSPYAPINETYRLGLIKYLNQGAQPVRDARRDDAYRQMFQACNGKYNIIREGPRSEGGVIIPVGNASMYSNTQYIYIEFMCIK